MRLPAAAVAVALAAAAGCADPLAGTDPVTPTRPPVPAGWTTVASDAGDLRLALPPWLVPFETTGAVFANEPPTPGRQQGLQLLAEGPRTAEPQPSPGESLERWLAARLESVRGADSAVEQLDLPGGRALVVRIAVASGTPSAWRLAAYAVRTPDGVAYLLIDGPPDAWAGREADADLVARLMEAAAAATR